MSDQNHGIRAPARLGGMGPRRGGNPRARSARNRRSLDASAPIPVCCPEFVSELEQLARLAAGQPELRLVVGEPGSGWSLDWRTRTISIDGGRLHTQTPDFTRGLVLHESAHASITRLSEILPDATFGGPQIFPLLNLLEDCRIETWMQTRFPGCAAWVREYNDCLFGPLLTGDDDAPPPIQFLHGIIGRWWFGKVPDVTQEDVRRALDRIWPPFQEMLRALPPSAGTLGGVAEAYAGSPVGRCYAARDRERLPEAFEQAVRLAQHQMWAIVHRDILPVFRSLLPPGTDRWLKMFRLRFLQPMPGQHLDGLALDGTGMPIGSATLARSHEPGAEPGCALEPNGVDTYMRAWERQHAAIDQVAEALLRWFQTANRSRLRGGCPHGTRVLLRAAMRFEADPRAYDRLWQRPLIPRKLNAHFSVVVDRSGSMEGEKMVETFHGLVLLCEVCHRVGLPLDVYVFSGETERLLGREETLSSMVRARLGTLPETADGGTDLAGALERVAADVADSPFQDRFVFVLSDGEPLHETAVRKQIASLAADDVVLVGLGLGPKTEKLAQFFPVSRVNLEAKQLPGVLGELLVRCVARS